jgi:FLVCR family MFS transporter
MMAMTQCAVWNTFSPISAVGERVFGWDTAGLSLLTNWGPISYLLGTFAFSWILDVKGMLRFVLRIMQIGQIVSFL